MSNAPPYRAPSTSEELATATKYGQYAILVGYDDVDLEFRPISVCYDKITGRSSVSISRGHGKITYTVELTANHATAAEITPSSGNKIVIASIYCATDAASGEIKLDFATSSIVVFRLYATKVNHSISGEMHLEGAVDEALTLTTTTGDQKVFLLINYREH